MARLFEKADLLFGDESWENNGTRFPASFIRRFGELPGKVSHFKKKRRARFGDLHNHASQY